MGLPAGTSMQLVATADYVDGLNQVHSAEPAALVLQVVRIAGVSIELDQPAQPFVPGQDSYIPLRIVNAGNTTDTIALSVSSSRGWQASFVYDENADGVHQSSEQWIITDTGIVVADGYCACFLKVSVPVNAIDGDSLTVAAVSMLDPVQGYVFAVLHLPPSNLQATAVILKASPQSPVIGDTVSLSGRMLPAGQHDLNITIKDPAGNSTTNPLTTQADGVLNFRFIPEQAGLYAAAAAFAGTTQYTPCSASVNIDVAKIPTSITLTANPANPAVGQSAAVEGTLNPGLQSPLAITRTSPTGTPTQAAVTADAAGSFVWNTFFDAPGDWQITASYAGSALYSSAAREIVVSAGSDHSVEIVSGPSVSPSEVASAASVQCGVSAVDSLSHGVAYAWSDGGAGGSFAPSADAKDPTYRAPANASGQDILVTLSCAARCAQDASVTDTALTTLVVHPALAALPQVIGVMPPDGATCVDLLAPIVVQFSKSMDQQATQQAVIVPPGLAAPHYAWSADGKTLTITHQGMFAAAAYTGVVGAGARDIDGTSIAGEYVWVFSTAPAAAFDPGQVSAPENALFATPHIVVNDPALPSSVTLRVGVPQDITVDPTTDFSGLVCVEPGADAGMFFSEWDAQNREIVVTAQIPSPAVGAEVVKSIVLAGPASPSVGQLLLDSCPGLIIRFGNFVPGDFDVDAAVTINDASLFIRQWSRWHQVPQPAYDPALDKPYDLAPRTAEAWPDWLPLGDKIIDVDDAYAFVDCWVSARRADSTGMASALAEALRQTNVRVQARPDAIYVTVVSAPGGMFQTSVDIPADAVFDPSPDAAGNLANVQPDTGAGTLFFTEYDGDARRVRLTGTVTGQPPYRIAVIHLVR